MEFTNTLINSTNDPFPGRADELIQRFYEEPPKDELKPGDFILGIIPELLWSSFDQVISLEPLRGFKAIYTGYVVVLKWVRYSKDVHYCYWGDDGGGCYQILIEHGGQYHLYEDGAYVGYFENIWRATEGLFHRAQNETTWH